MNSVPDEERGAVLFVCGAFPKSSEIAVFNQVMAVADSGVDVEVLCEGRDDTADHLRVQIPQNVRLISVPQRPLTRHKSKLANRLRLLISAVGRCLTGLAKNFRLTVNALNVRKYGAYARSFWLLYQIQPFLKKKSSRRYRTIHAQFGPNGVKSVLLRDIGAIDGPIVTSFRGYDLNVLPKQDPDVYQWLFSRGDWYTTDSEAMKGRLTSLGCDESRIARVPSCLDAAFWSECEPDMNADGCRLLTAGRLVACKGIDVAIQAVSLLRETRPDISIELSIAGEGPERAELEAMAAQCAAHDCIQFLGWKTQNELRQLMAEHHAFVLPSVIGPDGDEESQGLVLQEAQAAGLPVIASRLGGIPEGLVEQQTGYLFAPGDHRDLAQRLTDHIQQRSRWSEMSADARAFVRSEFSTQQQLCNLNTVYRLAQENHTRTDRQAMSRNYAHV